MDVIFAIVFVVISLLFSALIYQKVSTTRRSAFIREYKFPITIRNKVAQVYPHLSHSELDQVIRGLRDYFHISTLSRRKIVAMPSQVVDVAWHEFILFTRDYARFCTKALGRFLHHTPAEAMKSKDSAQAGLKRTWRIACHREHINPFSPKRLPVIFALDSRLKIPDGFHYELDCMKLPFAKSTSSGGESYCASHISCSSGCAGSAGDGGCSGDSGGGGD